MFQTIALLLLIVLLYSGYNLLIKVSAGHAPQTATSLIGATIVLQLMALGTSLIFTLGLLAQGDHQLRLNTPTVLWAAFAGICIGAAEIAYFYLFRGVGGVPALQASVAIPVIVAGTVIVSAIVSMLVFREGLGLSQLLGVGLVVAGMWLLINRV